MAEQPVGHREEKPKMPRELAREHMCDVLLKAYRDEQKGEKQAK